MDDEYAHQYEPDGYRHRNSCWYVMDKTKACDCQTFAADVSKMASRLLEELEPILKEKLAAQRRGEQ